MLFDLIVALNLARQRMRQVWVWMCLLSRDFCDWLKVRGLSLRQRRVWIPRFLLGNTTFSVLCHDLAAGLSGATFPEIVNEF